MKHSFKYNKEIELFLNGLPPNNLKKILFNNKIFAVDGAYWYLKKNKIPINYISGDFDTKYISNSLKKNIKQKSNIFYTYNQNYTDFDKALYIIYNKGFLNVNVWGASGKEQDHFLGNLSTALKYKNKLSIIFYDDYYTYFFSEKKNIFFIKKNKKISLYPFPKVIGLTTSGLKYPVSKEKLEIGYKIGIRNKSIKNKIEISYNKGELLIFAER